MWVSPLNCGMMGNTLWPPDLPAQITFATHSTTAGKHTGTIHTTVTFCIIPLEFTAIKTSPLVEKSQHDIVNISQPEDFPHNRLIYTPSHLYFHGVLRVLFLLSSIVSCNLATNNFHTAGVQGHYTLMSRHLSTCDSQS